MIYDASKLQVKMIYAVNPAGGTAVVNTHVMFAPANLATDAAGWQIKNMLYDTASPPNMIRVLFPRNDEGVSSPEFRFIADDYLSYTYGPE